MRHSSPCVDAFSLGIEITPEVIGAGVHELREFNYEFDDERPTREEHLRLRPHRDACLFFGCPDVDAACAELTARGVTIDQPPKVAPYGMKQMYIHDPDGFGLCFQWKAQDQDSSRARDARGA